MQHCGLELGQLCSVHVRTMTKGTAQRNLIAPHKKQLTKQ